MADTADNGQVRTGVRSGGTMPWDTYERASKGLVSAEAMDLQKNMAWKQGVTLTGLSMARHRDTWRAVVRAERGNEHLVAFVTCSSWSQLLDMLLYEASSGVLRFYPDRFWAERNK